MPANLCGSSTVSPPGLAPYRNVRPGVECYGVCLTTGILLRGPERSEGHVSSNDLVRRCLRIGGFHLRWQSTTPGVP